MSYLPWIIINKIHMITYPYGYHKDSWEAAYRYKIMLVRGKRFYKLQNYLPIAPPNVENKKGRPQTKKIRGGK